MKIFTTVYWEDKIRRLRWRIQRGHRGWAECDALNIDLYFMKTMRRMLNYLRNHYTAPPTMMSPEEWESILDRMVFLLGEMNESTCHKRFMGVNKLIERDQYLIQCKDEFFQLFSTYFYDLWD